MKKTSYYFISWTIIFGLIALWIFFILWWKKLSFWEKKQNITNLEKLTYIKKYLEENFAWNYPIPKWDLILLDKDLQQIHLEDKTQKEESINELFAIQWTLWWLNIDNKDFKEKCFDSRFSIWENKKFFTYSVTKDRKHFQLGTLDMKDNNYYSHIIWNISWSIIKDFESQNMVTDKSEKYLPYLPSTNNKYLIKLIKWDIETFTITEDENPWINKTKKDLAKWVFLPMWEDVNQITINTQWTNYVYKIIYPNWNVQLISPSKKWISEIKLNFESDWVKSKASIVNMVWKIAYNMVKLSDDSDYQIQDNRWWVLVIRWTQFTIDVDEDQSSTYLIQWSINLTKRNEKFLLTVSNNIAWFDNADRHLDMFKFPEKLRELLSYWVAMDIFLNPEIKLQIINQNIPAESQNIHTTLSWISLWWVVDIQNDIWKKYIWINLKWYFQNNAAIEIAKNRLYINDIMKQICNKFWYTENIGLNQSYNFLWLKDIDKDNINFELNSNLTKIVPQNTIIPFFFSTKDNSSLVYYDTKIKQIVYKTISSYSENDKRDWIFLICK